MLRTRDRVHLADGFSPCVVLLNNDLSAGIPDILKGIGQTVLPPLHGGWTTRRKQIISARTTKLPPNLPS
ncbi:glutamate--cysteine ligase [Neisseria gonorrhoeae]|uniref:Glutamate--cysteine ligase n=1 Tax=Neisseria gonorrhoeae TaxID=485 RepID=A0A378VZS9_NEIGO|nr:glutamate--cysteine ligase [Neisseria gonorrhoeae]